MGNPAYLVIRLVSIAPDGLVVVSLCKFFVPLINDSPNWPRERKTESRNRHSQLEWRLQLGFQFGRMQLLRQTDIAGYSQRLLIRRSKK